MSFSDLVFLGILRVKQYRSARNKNYKLFISSALSRINTRWYHGGGGVNVKIKEICLFVLRFYGPVNPMGLCQAWSVYLTTRLLGRLSPLSG